ncbi:SGNH/GDSL hydrolase family protein [Membranihabitans maritimus]|uniref:SGNH/GDSL hydrolase family protein n=1 Tax=Membranihabitans maritimus TaxID=2904244 RepID=UPI001F2EE77E|nr:SGNH/GDSL hydrolase family protein [Membranihabitans maritimus]
MNCMINYGIIWGSILSSVFFFGGVESNNSPLIPEGMQTGVQSDPEIRYFDEENFTVYGKYHEEDSYGRLPSKCKDIVRPVVWKLSKNSAGINIRFQTSSPEVWVKWELHSFASKSNMSDIGALGIDLYCNVKGAWQYVNSGVPKSKMNEVMLISDMDQISKKMLVNLPLYGGVSKIEIGVPVGYTVEKYEETPELENPIVFYGTSITQGASASRPGMAYPSIISRNLNMETVNLGFSGNGKFEASVCESLCDMEPSLLVLDCTPNSSPEIIAENALNFILNFRKCHSNVPVILMESIIREYSYFRKADASVFGSSAYIQRQNSALKKVYTEAMKMGVPDLHYMDGQNLIGQDHEATVDGTHLSDLGMMRIAERVQNMIRQVLNL